MTCKETIEILGDYLEAALSGEAAAELEAHLALCAPCQAYLATYRRTRELARDSGRVEMPDEMKRHLREFLVKQLGQPRA